MKKKKIPILLKYVLNTYILHNFRRFLEPILFLFPIMISWKNDSQRSCLRKEEFMSVNSLPLRAHDPNFVAVKITYHCYRVVRDEEVDEICSAI